MNPFTRIKAITVFGVVSTGCFLVLNLLAPQFVEERVESLLVDFRFQLRNLMAPPVVPQNIVIVEVDEKSLEKYGRWPWSRVRQAKLIERIAKAKPSVLAVDIFYPERESKKADAALAKTLGKGRGTIVMAAGFDVVPGKTVEAPDFLLDNALLNIKDQSRLSQAPQVNKPKTSIAQLSSQAMLGHVYSPSDLDGKLRWEYLYIKYADDVYPSLSLVAAAQALGKTTADIVVYAGRGVQVGDTYIPVEPAGRMRVDYLGRDRTLRYISAADVLSGSYQPSDLTGKVVFLGTSAISTYDFVVTPFSARMPGVEKNATVVENILNKRFLKNAPISVVTLAVIVTGLVLSLLLPTMRARNGLVLSFALMGLYAAGNQYLFAYHGYYANLFYPFANMAVISVFSGAYKYLTEERKAKELKKMFSHYVSPKIVEELLKNPELAKLGGYRREITVLFSDVRGFTTFSESRKPEEVVEHLNEYLHEMTDIIFKWDGTLDKFVGDEIMAFWGAPLEQPNHAELAIKCALNMSDKLEELQAKWRAEGKYPLDNGIGINTGDVLVGNIGSADKKMDYTIIGDHVNLGARVETLTRKYDSRVLITEFTFEKIRHLAEEGKLYRVDMKEMDTVKVKGKEIPVKIYGIYSVHKKTT
ncbi:MAG: adenylate/guanylate cyclase domain-containing protein [Nitrospirota bacterium]